MPSDPKTGGTSTILHRRAWLRGTLATLPAGAAASLVGGCGGSGASAQPRAQVEAEPEPQSPAAALQALRDGNRRWANEQPRVRDTAEIERIWTHTAATQTPFASVLGCADSRLAPELIFDQFVGDLFVVREAGNIAGGPTSLGSLEFAQAVLGSKLILVLGHTACGAVNAAFTHAEPGGNIQSIVEAITPGIQGAADLDAAIRANVVAVIESVRANSPLLRAAEEQGTIAIAGGVYDIASGQVTFL